MTTRTNPCAEVESRGLADYGPAGGRTLYGAGRPTIYGNYVAPAVASSNSPWHIQGAQPDLALCGKPLTGDLRRMNLHVGLLECSTCMSLGAEHPSCTPVGRTPSDPDS